MEPGICAEVLDVPAVVSPDKVCVTYVGNPTLSEPRGGGVELGCSIMVLELETAAEVLVLPALVSLRCSMAGSELEPKAVMLGLLVSVPLGRSIAVSGLETVATTLDLPVAILLGGICGTYVGDFTPSEL
jgi:hypothetical protein